jgi:hypothetical protein
MKVGIIGKPGSGKSTLFHTLTRGHEQVSHTKEPVHGVVVVPDPRFDYLVELYHPKKVTPGTIDFVDDVARIGGEHGREFSDEAMGELRATDAMALIINAFEPETADPAAVRTEAVSFLEEIALRDLMLIENRLERMAKQSRSPQSGQALQIEKGALEKLKKSLEAGERFADISLDESEKRAVAGFQLLTAKPLVVAVNVAEGEVAEADEKYSQARSYLDGLGIAAFCLSADLERQVAELDEADQADFLVELGITEPVRDKLIRAIYSSCHLVTFFTVGEKEVHAWPIPRASTALEAADSIHSDLARGFIRAEVISYGDVHAHGGWDEAKAAGRMRLVGKEHVIEDGDCLYIRFKV